MAVQVGMEPRRFFSTADTFSWLALVLCNLPFYSSISQTQTFFFLIQAGIFWYLIHFAVSVLFYFSHVSALRYSQKCWKLCSAFLPAPCTAFTSIIPFHVLTPVPSSAVSLFFFLHSQNQTQEIFVHAKKYLDTSNMRHASMSRGKRISLSYF